MTKEKFDEIMEHIILVHSEELKARYGDFVLPDYTKRKVYRGISKNENFCENKLYGKS